MDQTKRRVQQDAEVTARASNAAQGTSIPLLRTYSLQVLGSPPFPLSSLPLTLPKSGGHFHPLGGMEPPQGHQIASDMKPISRAGRGLLMLLQQQETPSPPTGTVSQPTWPCARPREACATRHLCFFLWSSALVPMGWLAGWLLVPQQIVEQKTNKKRWGKCICMSWQVFFQTQAAADWRQVSTHY